MTQSSQGLSSNVLNRHKHEYGQLSSQSFYSSTLIGESERSLCHAVCGDIITAVFLQVNKIREVPQHPHIVVTHTDSEKLYVWNTVTQPNRALDKA